MKNKSYLKFFLFVTLLILLIGFASSATVESNGTSKSIEKQDFDSLNTVELTKKQGVTDNVILIDDNDTKPTPTKININKIENTAFSENISISGKFTDINGQNLIKTPLRVNINGKSVTTKTDTQGNYIYDFKTNAIGVNNITVSYHGNTNFAPTSSNITFNVFAQSTNISVNRIDDVDLSEEITISGKYTDKNGVFLIKTPIRINLNNQTYSVKTDDNGEFTYKVNATQMGENNVTVSYNGNIRYNGANATTTFYVKYPTQVQIDQFTAQYLDNVTVTGRYIDATGRLLKKTPLDVQFNGINYTTKTDTKGAFIFTFKATQLGQNNLSISYPGNKRFTGAIESISFNVNPRDTVMTIDKIKDVQYSDTVSITGKYTDKDGVLLTLTTVNVNVNGKRYKCKTDTKGSYSLDIVANKVGVNNVSVSYPGNVRYNGTVAHTTFNVAAKDTILYLEKINNVTYPQNVSINGKYIDKNGIQLTKTPIRIIVDGFNYTTKTDDYGQFSLNIQPPLSGENKVTALYWGNTRYAGSQATGTFNVFGKSDILTINVPTTQYTNTATISGIFSSGYGNPIKYTDLTLVVNGKIYTVKTDSNGNYALDYKTTNLGINNATVSYYGNNNKAFITNNTKFNVTKKDTKLTIDPVSNATLGNNVTIKGKYTDSSGNPLKYTTVSLVVNDAKYGLKTDENGVFKVEYETFVSGVNHIEAYYRGTEKYSGTTINATFNVTTPLTGRYFKNRKTMVASVFASGTITSEHVTKWVNSGITDVYVRATEYDNDTSLLRKTINLCKNTNIKVHAWIIVFRDNGKWDNSIATQNKMKRFMKSVMQINGVEGVCLDYIRYSGVNPSIVNTSVITNFLKDVNYIAKNIDPRMEVSACVMPEITNLKYYYGQDLKAMENYVDYMICMAYKNNYYQDTAWMVDVTKSLLKQVKHAKVVTSLTTYSDMYGRKYLPLSEITSDIKAIMNAGSYGYSLFSKSTTPVYPKIF